MSNLNLSIYEDASHKSVDLNGEVDDVIRVYKSLFESPVRTFTTSKVGTPLPMPEIQDWLASQYDVLDGVRPTGVRPSYEDSTY